MTFLDNLSPEDILILTNAITVSLIEGKNANEMNALGNFITGIGCLMLSVASQQQYLDTLQPQQPQQSQQQANNSNSPTTPPAKDSTIIG